MKTQNRNQKQKHVFCTNRSRSILLVIGTFLVISNTVCANAPSGMTVSYNLETQDLRVTITHPVSDPTTHYIYKVELQKNGLLYNTSTYTSQPDSNSFTYTYPVNATTGDTIDVTASCVQGGSKTLQHTISTNNGQNNKSTPGFEGIVLLTALVIIIAMLQRKHP